MLLTKTPINHRVFFNPVQGELMELRNFNSFELGSLYFTTVWKLFSKIFIRSGKMHHVEPNSGILSNQVSKKSFYRLKDVDLRESHAKFHEKTE